MKRIYFDNNATTPLHPKVLEALPKLASIYGNPSSLHQEGRVAKEAVESARETIAKTLNIKNPDQVIFTSSATEANNHILQAVTIKNSQGANPPEIITSSMEHSSVFNTLIVLEQLGAKIKYCKAKPTGEIDLDHLHSLITDNTKLISIHLANNETGTLQPIKAIAKLAKEKDILLHTDAVQAIGKIPVNVQDLCVDFLTFSGHKIYGPKGIGGFFTKDPQNMMPILYGGNHEYGLRAGTENVLGIAMLEKAFNLINPEKYKKQLLPLTQRLRAGLHQTAHNCQIWTPEENSLSNTISVAFPDIDGQSLMMNLDLDGISISTGSACSTGSIEPSFVLKSMDISDDLNKSTIRISLGLQNKEEDIDTFLESLKAHV